MKTPFILLSLALATSGCVSAGKYDEAVAASDRAAAELRAAKLRAAAELKEKSERANRLDEALRGVEAKQAEQASELHMAIDRYAECSTARDEATAQGQQLRAELERQGKNVDQLLASKGALSTSLEQARARLEELRRAQVAAEARAALFRDLALRLRRMVDAGELEITLRNGRMVLVLPTDVLFDSGRAKVGPRGKEALSQVAAALATVKDRRFQVAGHTDNDPIRYSGFESNWELSTARALQVMKLMTENGVKPEALSAAGYGEFDPVASNDTPEHKTRNRRIEIVLQPNIDELVAVPRTP
ncbi:MAG TPA: OmpA family protein [Polyangiaceae bacterium]|nr:OmpA family protein [Polyangiaceae bacterium]